MVAAGKIFVSRVKMRSDIWRFPVAGSKAENTKGGLPITRQTGQVQTPSVSPKGDEVVYLSDNGGHANLWVAKADGSRPPRQITFEQDQAVVIGVPIWSPAGDRIVFIRNQAGILNEWLVNPDGTGPHELVHDARAAVWSPDGRWLYYNDGKNCIQKIPAAGGPPTEVRCGATGFGISRDGSTIYYAPSAARNNEIFQAQPENGPGQLLFRYSPTRTPLAPTIPALSPDDRSLAIMLKDAGTTDIWTISTADGSWRQITDFGRPTLIGRQVSWSPDGKFIYASVVDVDADIMSFDGLLP
jgi:Tol biopolymer transport system component